MDKKVWLVFKWRSTDRKNEMTVLGIYDNKPDAVERVNHEFIEFSDEFISKWGDRAKTENNGDGRADLSANNGYEVDVCVIEATPYVLNTPVHYNLWSTMSVSSPYFTTRRYE